jgi:hypothetical protein
MEMCKTLLGFAHFHRHGRHEPKTTKPDISFATKTGHFHLLPTLIFFRVIFFRGFKDCAAGTAIGDWQS